MTNIAATRYLTSSRVDLSSVFMPLSFGGQYSETGYKLSSGADLNTLFCKNYTNVPANKTSLLLSDGQDLSDVFEKRHTVGYSNSAPISTIARALYPLNSTTTYVAGDFPYGIVRWDGSSTTFAILSASQLNPTFGGAQIRTTYAVDLSNVYVGGQFATANGNSIPYITKWNGTSFVAVDNNLLNATVNVMYELDLSNVYVGGTFTNRIKILNTYTDTFTDLSVVGLNSGVRVIHAFDISNVFIGGDFTNGGNIGSFVTRWNGTQFNRLGDFDLSGGLVIAMHALDPEHVYIGGSFTKYGSNTNMNRVAMWDGTNIIALSTGISAGDVRAIYALDENHVYMGGTFNHIKMWNGSSFNTLSGGIAFPLTTAPALSMLKNNKTSLIIGGSNGVIRWAT